MRTPRLSPFAVLALVAAAASAQTAKPHVSSGFTIDDLIRIKHPSGHQWTPDGSHVWFTYDDGGVNNVWAVPADGSGPPAALTSYADGQSGSAGFWSNDGQTFFFPRAGGLLAVSVKGGTPRTAWPSASRARGFALSPDGTRVAFLTGSGDAGVDLIVHTIATNADQKIAHADGGVSGVAWMPGGADIAYTARARRRSRTMRRRRRSVRS